MSANTMLYFANIFRVIALSLSLSFWVSSSVFADVIKPALAEISVFDDNTIELKIDFSVEAVISEIGTKYKNTTESPNSDRYDYLRGLPAEDLKKEFLLFSDTFVGGFDLKMNGVKIDLVMDDVFVDIIGYKKRPRKAIVTYKSSIDNWPKTVAWKYNEVYGDSAFRWQFYKKDEYNWSKWKWLRNGKPSGSIEIGESQPRSDFESLRDFSVIGFDHVIPLGLDHILFIIGMALVFISWKKTIILVTSFTLAHTITLGMSMYKLIDIPGSIIEPLIAFSIAYVAIENLLTKPNFIRKVVVVFFFGLVHGMGFASMLKEFDMDKSSFIYSLIGFNIGVEVAQVIIISLVGVSLFIVKYMGGNGRNIITIPASILVAIFGIWMGIDRLEFI